MRAIALSLIVFTLAVSAGCRKKLTLRDTVKKSTFIFEGTVLKAEASLMPEFLPPRAHTYIVRVNKVYSDASFNSFTKAEITVTTTPPAKLRPNDQYLFLTRPLVFGKTLGVEGEARRSNPGFVRTVTERPELLLEDRIQRAFTIVQGRVLSLPEPAPGEEEANYEHDPVWRSAVVRVDAFAKRRPEEQITVYFPTSDDIVWHRSPRFGLQDAGVFLIQPEALDSAHLGSPRFTALHPLDFFPEGKIPEILRGRLKPLRGGKPVPVPKPTPRNPKPQTPKSQTPKSQTEVKR